MSQSSGDRERSRGSRGPVSTSTTPHRSGDSKGASGKEMWAQHSALLSPAQNELCTTLGRCAGESGAHGSLAHPPDARGTPMPSTRPPSREILSEPAYLSDSLGVPLGLGTGGSCNLPRWERRVRQAFFMGGCGHQRAVVCPPFLPAEPGFQVAVANSPPTLYLPALGAIR